MTAREFEFRGNNARAYESRDRELLLAGPAGTGKSVVLLTKCLTLLGKYPGCRGLFCRGTRTSLTQSGLVTWEDDVLGPDHPVLTANPCQRHVRRSYKFPNGSELVLAGLDDPGKTLSSQYDFVYIQEATEEGVTLDVYETLLRVMRNRRMRRDGRAWHQMMMDCNPTSPFWWGYQRSTGNRAAPGPVQLFESTHKDNPAFFDQAAQAWTPDGEEYIQKVLGAMTGVRKKRFYEGVWAAAEGLVYEGFVGKAWDDPEDPGHLFPAGWEPPRAWARVWGLDWGEAAPTVLTMAAVDPDGRAYFYREFYKTRLRPDELGAWAAGEVTAGREPHPYSVVGDHDPDMVKEFERGAREAGVSLHVRQADKRDQKEGITAVQARFDRQPDGRPRIFLKRDALVKPDPAIDTGPNCTLAEIVEYKYDANSIMDRPDPKAADHGLDALRYCCREIDRAFPAGGVKPVDYSHARRGAWQPRAGRR